MDLKTLSQMRIWISESIQSQLHIRRLSEKLTAAVPLVIEIKIERTYIDGKFARIPGKRRSERDIVIFM